MKIQKDRRAWTDGIQALKDHRCQSRILYPEKLWMTIIWKEKKIYDENKFKHFLPPIQIYRRQWNENQAEEKA